MNQRDRQDRDARQLPRLSYMVKQLELAVRAEMDTHARAHGLTTLQYTALTVLKRHPGMSGAELSRRSFVSPQSGSEMVGHLERKGLIERTPDARNRRILRMNLTKDGAKLVKKCDAWMDDLEMQMLVGLSARDAERLRRVLQICLRNLEDQRLPRSS